MILTFALLIPTSAIDGASILSQPDVNQVEVVGTVSYATTPEPEYAPQQITVVPCEYEDTIPEAGTACYWDAQTAGNGLGRSFMAYSDGTVIYANN